MKILDKYLKGGKVQDNKVYTKLSDLKKGA